MKRDEVGVCVAGGKEKHLSVCLQKSSSSSPPPPSSSSSASRPLSSVIELDDSVLVEAGVDESWSHERILQEVVSELRSKVLTELLKRPTSRVCIDAMQFLEIEGGSVFLRKSKVFFSNFNCFSRSRVRKVQSSFASCKASVNDKSNLLQKLHEIAISVLGRKRRTKINCGRRCGKTD